jgi:hypothetical protein
VLVGDLWSLLYSVGLQATRAEKLHIGAEAKLTAHTAVLSTDMEYINYGLVALFEYVALFPDTVVDI